MKKTKRKIAALAVVVSMLIGMLPLLWPRTVTEEVGACIHMDPVHN